MLCSIIIDAYKVEKVEARSDFAGSRRIVVKVGSSTLAYPNGKLNLACMENLVRQMADLKNQGREIILVTSGAISAGIGKLGLERRPKAIPAKQACAAVGQGILMHMYEKFFAEYGVTVGQVLLAREDFADRKRFNNARNALNALLSYGVVPVINENDTVAVDEIKVGDNDLLSALVAGLINADLLILLSDIDGLYTADPREDLRAEFIPSVSEITPEIEALAGKAGTPFGTGGMVTKLHAAKVATQSGTVMVIARGAEQNVIRRIIAGEETGTVFWASQHRLEAKKRWIAFGAAAKGRIHVDEGAARALLERGKSLLPSGVVRVEGDFRPGQTVSVINPEGSEIARGIVNFSAEEVARIMGAKTAEIRAMLGRERSHEVIHRNNMAVAQNGTSIKH